MFQSDQLLRKDGANNRITNDSCFIYLHIYQYYFIHRDTYSIPSIVTTYLPYLSLLLLLLPICQPYTESNTLSSNPHYYIQKALYKLM